MAQEMIDQQNEEIISETQKKIETEKQWKQGVALQAKKQKAALELLALRRQNELKQEEEHGSILENEQNLRKMEINKNRLQCDLKDSEDAKVNLEKNTEKFTKRRKSYKKPLLKGQRLCVIIRKPNRKSKKNRSKLMPWKSNNYPSLKQKKN